MNHPIIKIRIALFLAIFLWASAFVGIRMGLTAYTPGALALFRFLIASLCMFIFYIALPGRHKINGKDAILMMLVGVVGITIYNVALNTGELAVDAGIASFIVSQSPVLSILIAVIVFNEKLTLLSLFGILVSFIGISLITLATFQHVHINIGLLLVCVAALISAIYSFLQKPFLKHYHAIEVTSYVIWGGTLALLVYMPELKLNIANAPLNTTLAVVYLGVFPAAIAYLCWNYALAYLPVAQVVNYLYFMPIIATYLGWVILGERPTLLAITGGLVAMVGVWIANYAYKRKKITC